MKTNLPSKFRLKWQFIVLAVLVSVLLIIGGFIYYKYEERTIRNEKYNELKAVAELKINQIVQWRKERLGDAVIISQSHIFNAAIEKSLADRNNLKSKRDILNVLTISKAQYGYDEVMIASPDGKVLIYPDLNIKTFDPVTITLINKAFEQKRVIFSEIYYCNLHKKIHLDVIAPVMGEKNNPIAALILRINPADFLFPLIQSWPTKSKSAETLVVRKDGDSVLFVNELRHISNAALKLRIPLTSIKIPSVQAVLGYVGIWEGIDYRGIDVLADIQPIPGTPWFMIAKVDKNEIFSELYYRSIIIIAFISLMIILMGASLGWIYQTRQRTLFWGLLQAEQNLTEKENEFRTALYSIGDGIITTDLNGCVRQMNPVAEELTGWNESEASGKKLENIFQILNEETRNIIESPADKILREGVMVGLANHTLLISKKGKEIPIADSGAPILNADSKIEGVILVFRDQTRERSAENALRESEEKFRCMFENSPVGISMTSIDGTIKINEAFYTMLGYTEEELLSTTWQDITHPDDIKNDQKQLDFILSGERRTSRWEKRYIHKNGNIIWVDISTALQRDNEGKPLFFITSINDITNIKQSEEALRESEKKLREAQEMAHLGFWNWNVKSGEVEWSHEVFKIFCLDPKEFKPQIDSILELSPWPEDHQRDQDLIKRAVESHSPGNYEQKFLRPDQSIAYYYSTFRGNYDDMGNLNAIVGTVLDITERKQAEETIRENEKYFRELIESLPQLFWTCRVDGPCDYLSKQWVEYTGIPEAEQFGYRWLEQLHPEDRDRTVSEWLEKVKTGSGFDIEFRIRRNDGIYRWFKTRAVPMRDAERNIIKWFGSNTEIDELKKAEERLLNINTELEQRVEKRTSQLQISNKELEAFTYSVSHDLRAPLRHVSGYVDLLNKRFLPELSGKGEHYLNSITDSVHQMGLLIDDLLDFSRTGRVEMSETELDMNRIVGEVAKTLQQDDLKYNIEWVIAALPSVTGDNALMRLVWINLLSNAVKFTRPRKKAIIEIGANDEDKETIFFVRDNGVGFDMKYAQKLFGVFQRLHSTEEFEGTGIGLANVQRIISRHGGRTWAEAELDKGATFYFSLPKTSQLPLGGTSAP